MRVSVSEPYSGSSDTGELISSTERMEVPNHHRKAAPLLKPPQLLREEVRQPCAFQWNRILQFNRKILSITDELNSLCVQNGSPEMRIGEHKDHTAAHGKILLELRMLEQNIFSLLESPLICATSLMHTSLSASHLDALLKCADDAVCVSDIASYNVPKECLPFFSRSVETSILLDEAEKHVGNVERELLTLEGTVGRAHDSLVLCNHLFSNVVV